MPRRTVQEVTVQDVQKRRSPNKHYVSSCIWKIPAATRRDYSAALPLLKSGKVTTKSVRLQFTKPAQRNNQTFLAFVAVLNINLTCTAVKYDLIMKTKSGDVGKLFKTLIYQQPLEETIATVCELYSLKPPNNSLSMTEKNILWVLLLLWFMQFLGPAGLI